MINDIPGGSICSESSSAAALAPSPRRGSGLAATLPRLCGPDPALVENAPSLSIRTRHDTLIVVQAGHCSKAKINEEIYPQHMISHMIS